MQDSTSNVFISSILSGKGGVGKSMASVNMAVQLSKMGYTTALIDADLGLSNCATFFNKTAKFSVADWVKRNCGLEHLPQSINGLTLITATSDPSQANIGTEVMMDALDQIVQFLSTTHDFILIDTPAGAGEMTLWSLDAADTGILVLVDEPAAISDVYRLCKYIYSIDPEYDFAGIVNFGSNEQSAESTFKRFNTILDYFLKKHIPYLGFIPASERIKTAIHEQRPLDLEQGDQEEIDEIKFIAQQLVGSAANKQQKQPKPVH